MLTSLVSLTSAGKYLKNPSMLSSSCVIQAGKSFVINCNASTINASTLKPTLRLIITRFLRRSLDHVRVVAYTPIIHFGEGPRHIFNPDGRDWDFVFTGSEEDPAVGAQNIMWVINDAMCADTGIYFCIADHSDDTRGHQYLKVVPPVKNLTVAVSPQKENKEYTESDNVTMVCTVTGPRDLKIFWRMGPADKGLFDDYCVGEDIVLEEPVRSPDDDCESVKYTSSLEIQLTSEMDGFTFVCDAHYYQHIGLSANLTLSVSTVTIQPDITVNPNEVDRFSVSADNGESTVSVGNGNLDGIADDNENEISLADHIFITLKTILICIFSWVLIYAMAKVINVIYNRKKSHKDKDTGATVLAREDEHSDSLLPRQHNGDYCHQRDPLPPELCREETTDGSYTPDHLHNMHTGGSEDSVVTIVV